MGDAYRSEVEKLRARVSELEEKLGLLCADGTPTFVPVLRCPSCGTTRWDDPAGDANEPVLGLTRRRFCRGVRRLWCLFTGDVLHPALRRPHYHQSCTACGAEWFTTASQLTMF